MEQSPIEIAQSQTGIKWVTVAHKIDRSINTIYAWRKGTIRVPDSCRIPLDRAIGHQIDWDAYDLYAAGKPTQPLNDNPAPPPTEGTETPVHDALEPPQGTNSWLSSFFSDDDGDD